MLINMNLSINLNKRRISLENTNLDELDDASLLIDLLHIETQEFSKKPKLYLRTKT